MTIKRGLRRAWAPLRDFVCAMALFVVVFGLLAYDRTYLFQFPFFSLLSFADPTGTAPAFRGWGEFGPVARYYVAQSAGCGPIAALALIALVFSTIVTMNLAVLRHLRRVHASSRRGVWRGN